MRWIKASVLILMLLLAAGCSPNVIFELYNNTEEDLSVNGCGSALEVKPKKTASFEFYGCADKVAIKSRSGAWEYLVRKPTHNSGETGHYYYHRKRWEIFTSKLIVKLQINPDHKIIVLPEGTDFPAKSDILQPIFFPWQPLPSGGINTQDKR